ncbi:cystathionine gamma-synthase family protein [Gimibacter soli]|uniref:Cystathionine gamma-synthase family protein n=1 Tax=Gimibacter soli TaxID=3024400 RepID=A0AAE9XQI1_9PROT|nr:cystathionine gamma-synthase family protein [Gimibacter soli]WCL55347.1 cystathionine gamma-synthase family protein [Gimibacter soli]
MTDRRRDYRKKTIGNHKLSPETQMMGYGYDPMLSEGALKAPLFMTSTFVFQSAQAGKDFFEIAYGKRARAQGEEPGLIYSRINNPDLEMLEDRLALWEDAEKGLSFSSGMAAIATSLLAYLRPGDVIVHSAPIYGGTEYLIRNILPSFGIKSVEFEAGGDTPTLAPAIEEAKKLGRIAVIYGETPANPTNDLIDLHTARDEADKLAKTQGHRPVIMIDNTFLGPLWQKPLAHGADIVIYSLTKYVGGHSDVVAGAVVGAADVLTPIQGFRTILGTMCDPYSCWLLMRSLETLKLRMTASTENARVIAEYLRDHPKVAKVHYLGFLEESDPTYKIYKEQCLAAGSTFAFDIKGDEAAAFRVLDNLTIIKLAVSLGGTETLMEAPYSMTHSDVPDDVKERLGIMPSMLRISVGVENPDDLIADLAQALSHA